MIHVPRGSVAILSWRGGGTPTLLGPGLSFRLPVLQTVHRYSGGAVAARGTAPASSREGSLVSIPYSAEAHPGDQALLELHREGKGAGAVGALRALVEQRIATAAAAAGTYDLASGAALDAIRARVDKEIQDRFGPGARVSLSAPIVPDEVRAAFGRQAIYGQRRETGVRVVVVGVDGGDWDLIDPMIARGELPHFARLKREGAWSRMRSNVPTLSPLLWTTMATGKAPDKHGINDFLVVDPRTRRQVPINATFRKTKAIWSILTEAGLQNDVIAWWATWPAEAIDGHLISDRVAYSTWDIGRQDALRGLIHPPEYAPTVARLRVGGEAISFEEVAPFAHISRQELLEARRVEARKGKPDEDQESINVLVRVLASTETYRRIALDLLDERKRTSNPARLFAVYFQGVDEMNHRFAHCAPPRAPLCSDGDFRRFKDAIPAFYRYQDAILGEILERAPGATVLVISDHGFKNGKGRPRDSKPFIEAKPGLWHDLAGIFVAAGPAIRRGEIPFVTLYDIAPTILRLLGLPVPDDMPGKVIEAALSPEFVAAWPARSVPSYEELPKGPPAPGGNAITAEGSPSPAPAGEALEGAGDAEMVEQLRSLGYVGAGPAPAPEKSPPAGTRGPGPSARASPPPSAGIPTTLYHTNLGMVYLGKRAYDRAETEFRAALQIDPTSTQALTDLAFLLEIKGEPEKALEVLEGLQRIGADDDAAPLLKMAELFVRLGRPADGVAFMRRLEARQAAAPGRSPAGSAGAGRRGDPGASVALGMLQSAAGQPAEAEASLLRALRADPASVPAMQELFALYDGQGRAAELEPRLRAALQRVPRSPMHHNWLGLVLRRRDDLEGAEEEFKRTLESAPGLAGAMANLGSLYIQEGKAADAVALLKRALGRDPQSVESRTNLIVALGMTGDLEGAKHEVEQAESEGKKVPLYYNALAYALYSNGRGEEALAALRQSLTLDPRQPAALRLRNEIERGQPGAASPYR